MNKKIIRIGSLLFCVTITLFGCETKNAPSGQQGETNTPATSQSPTAEDALKLFKSFGLPIEQETVFTAEDDPNKLLGRPNQYIGKASWNDKRYKSSSPDNLACTLEIFDSAENLENRRKYVETISKSAPIFAGYAYTHKNILLRLPNELSPQQAAEYEKALKQL